MWGAFARYILLYLGKAKIKYAKKNPLLNDNRGKWHIEDNQVVMSICYRSPALVWWIRKDVMRPWCLNPGLKRSHLGACWAFQLEEQQEVFQAGKKRNRAKCEKIEVGQCIEEAPGTRRYRLKWTRRLPDGFCTPGSTGLAGYVSRRQGENWGVTEVL